jgi:hypothetical protein
MGKMRKVEEEKTRKCERGKMADDTIKAEKPEKKR